MEIAKIIGLFYAGFDLLKTRLRREEAHSPSEFMLAYNSYPRVYWQPGSLKVPIRVLHRFSVVAL
jgi:hypothetical protein